MEVELAPVSKVLRAGHLDRSTDSDLEELLTDVWSAGAPTTLAKQFLDAADQPTGVALMKSMM